MTFKTNHQFADDMPEQRTACSKLADAQALAQGIADKAGGRWKG